MNITQAIGTAGDLNLFYFLTDLVDGPYLSVQQFLTQLFIFNVRAFVLLLGCIVILRSLKGSAANRHFLLFSALSAITLVPLATQLLPPFAIEMTTIQGSLPDPLTDYLTPLGTNLFNAAAVTSVSTNPLPINSFESWSWFELIFVAYLAVGGMLLFKVLWSNFLVFVLAKASLPIAQLQNEDNTVHQWQEELHTVKKSLGVNQPFEILVSRHIASPFTWGYRKPVVIIPSKALAWPADVVSSTLLHEVAHIKRRDWLSQQICRIICACFWVNPLCWRVFKELCNYAEAACDDIALATGIKSSIYAKTLVDVAHIPENQDFRFASIGMANSQKESEISQRVQAILYANQVRSPNNFRRAALTWALVSGLLLPFVSMNAQFIQIIETSVIEPLGSPRLSASDFGEGLTLASSLISNIKIEAPKIRRAEILIDFDSIRTAAIRELKKHLGVASPVLPKTDGYSQKTEGQHIVAQNSQSSIKNAPLPKSDATLTTAKKKMTSSITQKGVEQPQANILYTNWARSESIDSTLLPDSSLLASLISKPKPTSITPVIENYRRLNVVIPKYPRNAEHRGIEGEVIVEFSINAQGRVMNPRIVNASPNQVFNRNVLKAIKKFTFTPHRVDGAAVAIEGIREIFVFKLA